MNDTSRLGTGVADVLIAKIEERGYCDVSRTIMLDIGKPPVWWAKEHNLVYLPRDDLHGSFRMWRRGYPIIYVAGPLTGPSIELNIVRAKNAGIDSHSRGFIPFVPHLAFCPLHPPIPDSDLMDMCLALVPRCDAMLLLPGWDKCRAALEFRIARQSRMPIVLWPKWDPVSVPVATPTPIDEAAPDRV